MQRLVFSLGTTAQPLGEICTCRILSGQDACAARRADVTCRIGIVKKHAFSCQLIDCRSLVKATSIAADIRPSKVIDKKENDVGRSRFLALDGRGNKANHHDQNRTEAERLNICHELFVRSFLVMRLSGGRLFELKDTQFVQLYILNGEFMVLIEDGPELVPMLAPRSDTLSHSDGCRPGTRPD